jgi:triosephosphate isomerase
MKRIPLLVGNWKMHKTPSEAALYVQTFCPLIASAERKVWLAVPFTDIASAAQAAQAIKCSLIQIGAQNMHDALEGAFTGEVSALMLKEAGAKFSLIAHSERRQYFHESNASANRKIRCALDNGLCPVLCIGESQEQRAEGKTAQVLSEQIDASLSGVTPSEIGKIVVAYEPIWAIGTGKSATPEMAQEAHQFCRSHVEKKWGRNSAEALYLLYGGSVKPDNIRALMEQPDIDGVLVGGASLEAKTFAQIVNY